MWTGDLIYSLLGEICIGFYSLSCIILLLEGLTMYIVIHDNYWRLISPILHSSSLSLPEVPLTFDVASSSALKGYSKHLRVYLSLKEIFCRHFFSFQAVSCGRLETMGEMLGKGCGCGISLIFLRGGFRLYRWWNKCGCLWWWHRSDHGITSILWLWRGWLVWQLNTGNASAWKLDAWILGWKRNEANSSFYSS